MHLPEIVQGVKSRVPKKNCFTTRIFGFHFFLIKKFFSWFYMT
jgi:hypothetical protein